MISRHWLRGSVALLALATTMVTPVVANADTACTTDSDCGKGFICQMTGISGCPLIAACTPGDAGTDCVQPACQPQVVNACEPGPCTTDSDCGDGMVCHPDSVEACGAPACAPGQACAQSNITCTTTTMSTCVPKYDLPCQVDSDCGPGFNCTPDTVTVCSGSSGTGGVASGGSSGGSGSSSTGSSSAGSATMGSAPGVPVTSPPPSAVDAGIVSPPVCTTTTLSTSSCVAQTIACSTSATCPSGWTCTPQATAVPLIACAEPVSGSGTVPVACDAGTPTPPPSLCVPPYYTVASSGSGVASTLGSGVTTVGGASTPSVAPASTGADGTASSTPDDTAGGCQMTPRASGPSGWALFGLVGLAGLTLRRRRVALARRAPR